MDVLALCLCIVRVESCTAKEVAEATTETPAILGKASRRRLSNLVTLSMCHDAVCIYQYQSLFDSLMSN